jgi:hypothetical protein
MNSHVAKMERSENTKINWQKGIEKQEIVWKYGLIYIFKKFKIFFIKN